MVPCEWRGDDAFAHEHLNANGFVGPWLRNSSAPPLSENCIAGFDIARPTPVAASLDTDDAAR